MFATSNNIQILSYQCSEFPSRLNHCEDAPVILFKKGNGELNASKVISVVGTRKASDYGRKWCQKIVEQLASHQAIIVSGLAYGIDTYAHKTALDFGLLTIGVLAHGLDSVYPSSNRKLSEQMLESGALLTEFLIETNPDRENFVKRNRIVAGMSDATIVIQSPKKGGALITAEIANSYSRDVFAIPASLGKKNSEGCNPLIKTNRAALLTDISDIEYLLDWEEKEHALSVLFSATPYEEKVIKLLSKTESKHIDALVQKSSFSSGNVAQILLSLELQNVVFSKPGKRYLLR